MGDAPGPHGLDRPGWHGVSQSGVMNKAGHRQADMPDEKEPRNRCSNKGRKGRFRFVQLMDVRTLSGNRAYAAAARTVTKSLRIGLLGLTSMADHGDFGKNSLAPQ